MGGHRKREVGERPKRLEIRRLERRPICVDNGEPGVAVGRRPPMAWNMFDDRQ